METTGRLQIPVKLMTPSEISDHVAGMMNFFDENEQRSMDVFRSKTPTQMAELLIQNPPTIMFDDESSYAPQILQPSRNDRSIADRLTSGTYDPNSPGHRLSEIGSYLLLPQIPIEDPEFDTWQSKIEFTLSEMDMQLGIVDPQKTYTYAFKKALSRNQHDPNESKKVLRHYRELRNYFQWTNGSETDDQAIRLLSILSGGSSQTAPLEDEDLAKETRELIYKVSNFIDKKSNSWKHINRQEVDHLSIGETLDSLLTHIANAKRMAKTIITKSDLRGHGQACLDKLSKFAAGSPSAFIEQINQNPPKVKVLLSTKELREMDSESTARSEYKELSPDIKIKSPTSAEIEAAAIINERQFTEKERNALAPIVAFLETPRVDDGFGSDHESRKIWEESVTTALSLITTDARRRLSSDDAKKFPQLDEMFNTIMTNTKYSKNNRMKVFNGLTLLLGTLSESDNRRILIQGLMNEYTKKKYNQTYLDQDEKDDQEFDADTVADDISWIAQRAMYFMNYDSPPQI